tara:strand:+ start:296 stop:1009 length:714 start_codon:yes stop_codon:yes gene_type:complete
MDDLSNFKGTLMNGFVLRLVLCFTLINFSSQNSDASSEKKVDRKKLLVKEEAVFKIKERVFFLSDLKPIIKEIRFVRCLSSKSLILQGVGLNRGVLLTIPVINSVQSLNRRQEEFLRKLIRVIKASIYIKGRQKEFNKSLFKSTLFRRCKKRVYGSSVKNENKKDLMLTESFLKDRFDPKSQAVDLNQYEIFKKKNKVLNEKALKEAYARKRNLEIVESIKLFVASLDKRISHETYF